MFHLFMCISINTTINICKKSEICICNTWKYPLSNSAKLWPKHTSQGMDLKKEKTD